MNWSQVLAGLKQGKKYRRECWGDSIYIYVNCNQEIYMHYYQNGHCGCEPLFYIQDFDATDWIEVIE